MQNLLARKFHLTLAPMILSFVILIAPAGFAFAATITSNGTGGGTWSSPSTWSGGVVPSATSTDTVIIASGDTVTLSANLNQTGVVTINSGGTLNDGGKNFRIKNNLNPGMIVDGTFIITVNNGLNKNGGGNNPTVQVNNGGIINFSTTAASTGVANWTLNSGSTIEYSASGNQTLDTSIATPYADLILSGSGTKTMNNASISVSGTLSIAPTGTAKAKISNGQNLTVNALTLGGLGRVNGTWGYIGSGAAHIDTTYFASGGTGTLDVTNDTRTTPTLSVTNSPIAYDGSAHAATVSASVAGSVSNILTGGAATQTNAGTYAVTADFTPTDTTSYTTLTGASAGSFIINQAEQTISFGALAGKTYGDADFAVSATSTSGLAPTFTSQTTGVCTVSGSTVHIVAVGTCTIRASQVGDSTYNAAPDVDQSFTVATKTLTVTATGINKLYDGTTVATVTLSSDKVGSDDVTPSYTSATFATSTVGTGIGIAVDGISIGGTAAGNYTLANTAASTTANITTASATITLDTSDLSRLYDATAQSVPVLSTVPADLSYTVTYDGSLTPPTNVGTYAVLATITDPNYAGTASTTLTITARPITVTAATDSKTYDGTTSSTGVPTITSGSLASGDSVTWTQTFDTKNVGTGKTLTPSGTVSDGYSGNNYSYTFVATTTGEIVARTITVTAVANTKAYDGGTTALGVPTLTAGTLAAGDTGTFSESYDTKDVGSTHMLTPAGTIADAGVVDMTGNYAITFNTIATGIITARPLTVTGITADNKTYDATTDATLSGSGVLSGVVGSEEVSLTGTPVGTFADVNAATGKTVTIAGLSLSGADIGNYSLTTPTTTADITTRAITITAQPNTKTYDGTTDAAAIPTYSADLQGADTITDLAETYDTKHAGTGKTLSVSAYTVNDGNSGANYTVTTVVDHTGVIDQKAVTVTAAANTKVSLTNQDLGIT